MPCLECDRLLQVEIDLTRRAAHADDRLHRFSPEPPFNAEVVTELRAIEQTVEEARAKLLQIRSERAAHSNTRSDDQKLSSTNFCQGELPHPSQGAGESATRVQQGG
jgi:hypothetical protein